MEGPRGSAVDGDPAAAPAAVPRAVLGCLQGTSDKNPLAAQPR